ncbi:probable G-protein coupled receptor 153 [Lates japonicus]|uniref:Probable G-protein coupled receptor 153 n=1 Tax=Lates japonicus TaxID=270547 RepID=A0AAD3RLH9_LATJO|nr:probable G-protein coupled receptor 153 [Lates japonicus]
MHTTACLYIKVVSFASLKYDRSYDWMVLCVLWCSIAQSILLPMFLWACDRYRADIRMVWEKCVAIMSNDDVDEENSQDGGIHADLIYDRPYDYSSAPEIVTVDRNANHDSRQAVWTWLEIPALWLRVVMVVPCGNIASYENPIAITTSPSNDAPRIMHPLPAAVSLDLNNSVCNLVINIWNGCAVARLPGKCGAHIAVSLSVWPLGGGVASLPLRLERQTPRAVRHFSGTRAVVGSSCGTKQVRRGGKGQPGLWLDASRGACGRPGLNSRRWRQTQNMRAGRDGWWRTGGWAPRERQRHQNCLGRAEVRHRADFCFTSASSQDASSHSDSVSCLVPILS